MLADDDHVRVKSPLYSRSGLQTFVLSHSKGLSTCSKRKTFHCTLLLPEREEMFIVLWVQFLQIIS